MTQRVYLSLGSNLGDRRGNLRAAVGALRLVLDVNKVSSTYETDPIGVTDQPNFLNLALESKTDMPPMDLLREIKRIEREAGRTPTYRWGPRVLDIDILLYGDQVLDTPELTIPHPRMVHRAFVLVPLAEIAPDVICPGTGVSIEALRDSVDGCESVRRLPESNSLSDRSSPSD